MSALYFTTTPVEIEAKRRFPRNDLTGQRFGRWTVFGFAKYREKSYAYWHCVCDCGTLRAVRGKSLTGDEARSCGCSHRDLLKKGYAPRHHGHAHKNKVTRTYRIWQQMKARCTNPLNKKYPCYGWRGIEVCREWLTSFMAFLEDMGECPPNLQLDRKDTNGNYTKTNCRWTTSQQQQNNRRNNTLLTHNGETATLAEWSRITGISSSCLSTRLLYLKWTVERALTTPVSVYKNRGRTDAK
mgnify:CR=1 FL=1